MVAGTCRPYMSSLIYCNQTKYGNKHSHLWNLCVLLTYIILLLRIVKFYMNNYKGKKIFRFGYLHLSKIFYEIIPLMHINFCSTQLRNKQCSKEESRYVIEKVFFYTKALTFIRQFHPIKCGIRLRPIPGAKSGMSCQFVSCIQRKLPFKCNSHIDNAFKR